MQAGAILSQTAVGDGWLSGSRLLAEHSCNYFFEASLEDKMIDRSRQTAAPTHSRLAVQFKRSLCRGTLLVFVIQPIY